jgi:tetratricopeptide (TPR) repeat protein
MTRRCLTLALTLTLTAFAGAASAQPADDVEALHRRGVALREEGRAAEALAMFRRAHELRPEPRSLVRMALAEAELGRWAEADEHLSAAVESPNDRFIRQHRRDLDAELAGIRGHVGRLDLQSSTPGVVIALNGADPIPVPSTPLRVPEGALNFELRAPGCQTVRRSLTITPRSTAQVIVQLECNAAAPAPTPALPPTPAVVAPQVVTRPPPAVVVRPPDAPPASSHGSLRTAAWATAGAAVVFVGVGAVATGLGSAAADRWNDDARCLINQQTRGENCADDGDTADLMRPLALGGFVVGGLAAVTSAVLFIVSREPSRAPVAWRCGQGPGTFGLSCGASF